MYFPFHRKFTGYSWAYGYLHSSVIFVAHRKFNRLAFVPGSTMIDARSGPLLLATDACLSMVLRLKNYLRYYRRRFGLTQRELAFLLGLSDSAISRIERNRSQPTLSVALACQALFGA